MFTSSHAVRRSPDAAETGKRRSWCVAPQITGVFVRFARFRPPLGAVYAGDGRPCDSKGAGHCERETLEGGPGPGVEGETGGSLELLEPKETFVAVCTDASGTRVTDSAGRDDMRRSREKGNA